MMPDNDALLEAMFPQWMIHFKANLPIIWQSSCVSELKDVYSGAAIIIGAGPSLDKQLPVLAEMQRQSIYLPIHLRPKVTLICTDRALIPCLKAGIVPSIVTSIDSDRDVWDYYRHKKVQDSMDFIKAVFGTFTHPYVVRNWKGSKYFVNTHLTGKVSDPHGQDAILQAISGKIVMNTGGNVGIFSFILAAYLGAQRIVLVGMDMDGHHEIYAEAAKTWLAGFARDLKIDIVNCTEGGNLYNIEGVREQPLNEMIKNL